jgi:phosphoenolpyruvate-protein kinase (PTS system EI component)
MTFVSDVVSLAKARAAKQLRDLPAPRHPALRWLAGGVYDVAHRRGEDDTAVCGAAGELTLALPEVPLCPQCYPAASR